MGDGQECGGCRRSRRNCECRSPFRVISKWKDGKEEITSCYNDQDIKDVIRYDSKQGALRFKVERYSVEDKVYRLMYGIAAIPTIAIR